MPTPQATSAAHGTTVTTGGRGSATVPAARTLATASRVSSTVIPKPAITPSTLAVLALAGVLPTRALIGRGRTARPSRVPSTESGARTESVVR